MNWNEIYKKTMLNLGEVAQAVPWEDKAAYSEWLGQTYHFVVHSTRILALASARTPPDQQSLHNRFIDHSREERGHEILLINDLKALGFSMDSIPEHASTAALYKTQYYWIEHGSTDAFMGWVMMLESFAAQFSADIYQKVRNAHGPEASVFLKVHSVEDQDHIEKAKEQITALPITHQADTILNFQHCASYYGLMLDHCARNVRSKQRAA